MTKKEIQQHIDKIFTIINENLVNAEASNGTCIFYYANNEYNALFEKGKMNNIFHAMCHIIEQMATNCQEENDNDDVMNDLVDMLNKFVSVCNVLTSSLSVKH